MEPVYRAFTFLMEACYGLVRNYGAAILVFTFFSRILLLPLSVWVHKNSIKMVRIQPDVNFIHASFFGDKDRISEELSALYKHERYRPLLTVLPTVVQLILLLGVIEAVRRGMSDPLRDMRFLGIDLRIVPVQTKGAYLLSPVLAGVSAWIMCWTQNRSNVLQHEQAAWNQWSLMILSVGISLYLGFFVTLGVVLYWITSNLLSVAQMYALNAVIDPRKYVDYARLEESKKRIAEIRAFGAKDCQTDRTLDRREKSDFKRFFKVVNKHVVFYSEKSGFYKYFKGIIEYLLKNTKLSIHYVTSDPDDAVFLLAKREPRIRPYYLGGKRLITLMMKLEADMVIMTMPDIENYHIKRSYIRPDVEYLYIPHGMGSNNLTLRYGAIDHYDTVFCAGPHQKEEAEKQEAFYGLPKKKLIECGYPLIDDMRAAYRERKKEQDNTRSVLIAPSWQENNIIDSCLDELLDALAGLDFNVTVRPHPQEVKQKPERMRALKEIYEPKGIEFQTDFSENSTVFDADLLITDWSDIACEYAFTTNKPVLFVDTPMKVMNPRYKDIDTIPINIWIRNEIGCVIGRNELACAGETVRRLLMEAPSYAQKIEELAHRCVYHLGAGAEEGGQYIVQSLMEKINKRKDRNRK